MRRVLLLNGSREPLSFISEECAIILVLKDKVEVLSSWEGAKITSARSSWPVPALIVLKRYINKRWRPPRFRRRTLFNRDGWTCQYCGEAVLPKTAEVEHVMPTSRSGKTSWTNCVTACRKCNKRKRDKTPDEADMPLLNEPLEPHLFHFLDASSRSIWHPSWNDYMGQRQ